MIEGFDEIIACPHCKGMAKHFTLLSVSMFNPHWWTDGFFDADMAPRLPPVVRCVHCREFYWLSDAEELGPVFSVERDPDSEEPREIEDLTEDEFYLALESNLAKDRDQEKQLRILAWHRRNHRFRPVFAFLDEGPEGDSPPLETDIWKYNLDCLLELLDDGKEEERLFKAEALRETGRFDEALETLQEPVSEEREPAARLIRDLCEKGDVQVREIPAEGDPPLPVLAPEDPSEEEVEDEENMLMTIRRRKRMETGSDRTPSAPDSPIAYSESVPFPGPDVVEAEDEESGLFMQPEDTDSERSPPPPPPPAPLPPGPDESASARTGYTATGRENDPANALEILLGALRHPSEEVRKWAAESLRGFSSNQVVEALIEAVRDSSRNVALSAAESLAHITGLDFRLDYGAWKGWFEE